MSAELAHAFLLGVAAGGAAFFVLRRKTDPLALVFLAVLSYFTPGLVGVARIASEDGSGCYHMALEPVALLAMAIVLSAIVVAAVFVDHVPSGASALKLSAERFVPGILLVIAIVVGGLCENLRSDQPFGNSGNNSVIGHACRTDAGGNPGRNGAVNTAVEVND
jgi:hypothetical protein